MAKKKHTENSISFEEALEKLEQAVLRLEDGQLGLSESLAQYEEGVRHLKHCHQTLAAAERKIELLTSVDQVGNTETETFSDEELATSSKNKPSSRRSQRSAKPIDKDEADDVDTQRGLF